MASKALLIWCVVVLSFTAGVLYGAWLVGDLPLGSFVMTGELDG